MSIVLNYMKEKNKIILREYESPCGALMLGAYGARLCLCDWMIGPRGEHVRSRLHRLLDAESVAGQSDVTDMAAAQLDEYFAGERRQFDVPLLLVGTVFQKMVWRALLTIPWGFTASYGDVARQIGMPHAVRAVAGANGANSISIFVPCHRVIGSDHKLTGYAGGLAAKEYLLKLEKAQLGL